MRTIFSKVPLIVIEYRIKYASLDVDPWYSGYKIPDETRDEINRIFLEYIKENIGRKTKDGVGLHGTVWHGVGNFHMFISKVRKEDVKALTKKIYAIVTRNMIPL